MLYPTGLSLIMRRWWIYIWYQDVARKRKKRVEMVRWMPTSARTEPLWDGCIEAGDIDYLVSRGYAHVIVDCRGTGTSEGVFGFHAADAPDLYDLVEWIAAQPWCNGNVGTIGISWFGAPP